MNEDVTCGDVVSNESEDGDNDQDMCDHLLRHYPVPGEIWVHLRTQCNYMSSLLAMYNCPSEGDPPYIANNVSIEPVLPGRASGGPLGELFQTCLAQHCKRSPWKYLHDLRHDRVWFFWFVCGAAVLVALGHLCHRST